MRIIIKKFNTRKIELLNTHQTYLTKSFLRILYYNLVFKINLIYYSKNLNISQLNYQIIIMLCFGFAIIDTLFLKIFVYYNYIIRIQYKFKIFI